MKQLLLVSLLLLAACVPVQTEPSNEPGVIKEAKLVSEPAEAAPEVELEAEPKESEVEVEAVAVAEPNMSVERIAPRWSMGAGLGSGQGLGVGASGGVSYTEVGPLTLSFVIFPDNLPFMYRDKFETYRDEAGEPAAAELLARITAGGPQGVSVSLHNRSANDLFVNWGESRFILPDGSSSEVIATGEGVDTVLPDNTLSVLVYPAALYSEDDDSGGGHGALFAGLETVPRSSSFALYLVLEIEGTTTEVRLFFSAFDEMQVLR